MNYKISIIVPVYNTAEYLEECIRSLIFQTLPEIEILLVDDGSTDNSWEILYRLSCGNNRIKLFKEENAGQGSARNLALDNASGEYILFVDSDDWISVDMGELLLQSLNSVEVDVLCFNYNLVYSGEVVQKNRITEYGIWTGDETLDAFFMGRITGHACNKLYKRSLIELSGIRFSTDKRLYEDLLFTVQILSYAKIVQYIPDAPYFYRIRTQSSTQSFDIRMLDQLIMLDRAIDFMKGFGNYSKFQNVISRMYSVGYVDILIRSFRANTYQPILYRSLSSWRGQVKLKFLSWKYKIIYLASEISNLFAKWVYIKLISDLYARIALFRNHNGMSL